ncbi:MAG: IS1634 family transposase [Planctomycetaceae bacterium]|nr:IS1634 family transposase [Planctomycetaceae bacterium]
MFFRTKTSGPRTYLQVVENRWEGGRSRQRVVATLGRLDQLQDSGQLDGLLASGARLARSVLLLSEHAQGRLPTISIRRIGAALVFQRLWHQTGCQQVIERLLKGRRFEFPIERAIFLTVLHRLFDPGSDRAADKWKDGYQIEGCEDLQLHHLYRAMGWLGDELPPTEQVDKTPFAPRCNKDLIEEALFARRRDLFTELQVVFFDTTSIYFEGQGGEAIGQRGYSKDHRPDLKQMIVGAVLDGQGRPICCELWPGNTADVTTLIPVVDRLRARFGVTKVCIVADRGMISKETIEALEHQQRGWQYILGARMRSQNEVKDDVLGRAGRYRVVHPQRQTSADPAPLKVKEVLVAGRRYIVCLNEDEARKDAADREAIVASLREKLRSGEKSLIGNKGYRRYLSSTGPNHFQIDEAKIQQEARYDGKWVLRTNTDLETAEVALQYKRLWMVEAWFRSSKSLLQTRPIYHKCDETIRGHVFCSFLALVLRQELEDWLARDGHDFEWADVIQDLESLQLVEVEQDGKRFLLRSEVRGTCGAVMRAAGVAVPPTVQQARPHPTTPEPDPGATPRM